MPGSHRALEGLPYLSCEVLALTKARVLSLCWSTLPPELGRLEMPKFVLEALFFISRD